MERLDVVGILIDRQIGIGFHRIPAKLAPQLGELKTAARPLLAPGAARVEAKADLSFPVGPSISRIEFRPIEREGPLNLRLPGDLTVAVDLSVERVHLYRLKGRSVLVADCIEFPKTGRNVCPCQSGPKMELICVDSAADLILPVGAFDRRFSGEGPLHLAPSAVQVKRRRPLCESNRSSGADKSRFD